MLPPIPSLHEYEVSPSHGFLPDEPPLEVLPDPYYLKWEAVVKHLQALLLSKRLRGVVQELPVITTSRLKRQCEWRRAYTLLSFMTHAYIWGGDRPEEVVPPSISIPYIQVCKQLELPTVATYAGVCLWNWKPIFDDEHIDSLGNLSTLVTFTGSLDESWFYLISVAIEARGGPTIPLMLDAISAARHDDFAAVTERLQILAEKLDELSTLLQKMYENCDPHVFYHRIRPFLAGSKNMTEAGLPRGVKFDTGSAHDAYCQYGGGSNAQSSLIQFFDIVLGVEHRPTGTRKSHNPPYTEHSSRHKSSSSPSPGTAPPSRHNFIHEMRSYMPGPHRRFLAHVSSIANIREFVDSNRANRPLTIAYDACLAMLRNLRDKHMQMVSRYIIIKSHESKSSPALSPRAAPSLAQPSVSHQPSTVGTGSESRRNQTTRTSSNSSSSSSSSSSAAAAAAAAPSRPLRGTGGTALIPFLKQARDETGEPAVDDWFGRASARHRASIKVEHDSDTITHSQGRSCPTLKPSESERKIVGLAEVWTVDDYEGGICHC